MFSTRNKRFTAVLFTLLLFVVVDRLGSRVIQATLLRSTFRYSKLYRGDIDAEIITMGNSRGINSFYTPEAEKLTQKKCFSLAYNGMGSYEHLTLFQDLIAHNQKPKLILLEVTCLKEQSHPKNLRPFWSCSERLAHNARQEAPTTYATTQVTHLYRFNTEMAYRVFYYLWRNDQTTINRYKISPAVLEKEQQSQQAVSLELPNDQNMAPIVELIRIAKENDIQVHLYMAPYLPSYSNRIENLAEWHEKLKSYIGDTPFWDLSGAIQDSALFADAIHTNLAAAPSLVSLMHNRGMLTWEEPATDSSK